MLSTKHVDSYVMKNTTILLFLIATSVFAQNKDDQKVLTEQELSAYQRTISMQINRLQQEYKQKYKSKCLTINAKSIDCNIHKKSLDVLKAKINLYWAEYQMEHERVKQEQAEVLLREGKSLDEISNANETNEFHKNFHSPISNHLQYPQMGAGPNNKKYECEEVTETYAICDGKKYYSRGNQVEKLHRVSKEIIDHTNKNENNSDNKTSVK